MLEAVSSLRKRQTGLPLKRAAVNTFMGGASAGLFAIVFKHIIVMGPKETRKFRDDAASCANAFLGGMVANGAGMDTYEPWEAPSYWTYRFNFLLLCLPSVRKATP